MKSESVTYARASRIASSCPKDFNFASFMYSQEAEYPMWSSKTQWLEFVKSRPESVAWNSIVCALALICFIIVSMDYEAKENVFGISLTLAIDTAYNAVYGLHVVGHFYRYYTNDIRWYLVDLVSYSHYLTPYTPAYIQSRVHDLPYIVKIICYHLRFHRPFRFLWGLNDYYLKGSMSGTLFKYWYIFTVLHVMCANLYLWTNQIQLPQYIYRPDWLQKKRSVYFFRAIYIIYKRFIPIGMDIPPALGDEGERLIQLLTLTIGSLMVTGITIASLSLAIALHMRPEEMFRARVRLIMADMKATHVSTPLRDKVETFYRMYWHKQKAVSVTRLLPTYPPTLANTIYTDIYFEAQQRSIILRDLSYQMLSEIAQRMKTINYIPGDIIIRRNSYKFAMVYISYGDVEMLTAEDDETPMLRFTRGTIMNPCAGAAAIATTEAQVCVRAATFCTAHILTAVDMWRVGARYGHINGQSYIMHSSFREHFDNVVRHYEGRPHPPVKHKSTILTLKQNLIELKEARDESGKLILGRQDIFLELAGCYIMRNQADAALTEDSDSICLRPTFPCILQPASSLLIVWNVFVAIMTIIVTFVHPYNLVFTKKPHVDFRFFDFMMTVVYIVDIIVHLSTGAKIEEGVPITLMQTSSQQVSSFWFVLDVLSVMPIFNFIGDGSFAGINKVCKLPKVFRILKEMEDISLYQSDALRFFAYCLLIILLNWLVATLQQGYMCLSHGYCNLESITTEPYWAKGPLDDSSNAVVTRLWYSIFWALSFTTFGAHKTFKMAQYQWDMQLFTMILLEICGKFHVIMEAVYSATIMVKVAMRDQYKSCIENVKIFLVKNDVDPVLRHRFISYLQLCWYTDKAYSITHGRSSIHFDLPQHVYQDISAIQRNKYIFCIPFMKHLHPEIVKTLCAKAYLFYTSPQEILLNTGDICNEIYVIKQGFCEVIDPTTKNVVSVITAKKHFGDVECLLRIPAYYTVRAVSHVQIFSVSRKHLGLVLSTLKIKDAINYTKQRQEYLRLINNRKAPFLKYEMAPPAPSRQIFPILRKHEPDTAFLHPFQKLGFFSITRYVFPRFTIRPDGKYLRRYEWFRALCAFLSAFIFPVYYLLVLQFQWLEYFTYFLDFAAYYDVLQRLLVGYFNEDGILVYHPVSTAAHYIRGPMIADLLGCLPFEHFDDLTQKIYSNENYTWTPDTMQYLMCNRILQLYRFPAALEVLDEYIGRQDIIFVIKAIPILMVVLNTVTAFLLLLSVKARGIAGGGWSLIPLEIDFTPWIVTHESAVGYNITETPLSLFITVYYWSTFEITTTGLECFQPNCYAQLIVLVFGMLIGSIMIPYMAVRVLSIRSNVNQALAAFQENMKDLVVFMEREKFHKDLQEEALSYYEYTWEKTGGTDYRSILKLCDQITLRTDAILHIYGQTFHKCPILYRCDPSLQRLVGRAAHSVYYRGGMTIIDRDDVITDLYFVDYGIMEARDPEDDDLMLTKLPRGSMFGNLDNKTSVVCISKFVASTNLHLLRIEAWLFYKILQDFPIIRGRMIKYRPNDENYIIGSLRNQSVVQGVWKERAMSAAIIVVTREGILKYIHHHEKVLQVILIIVSIICVYGDLYNAAFQDNRQSLLVLLYAMDAFFICKIVINYFMPSITEEKSESRHALEEAKKKYYRGDFKYDIFSVLPIELFCFIFDNRWQAFAFLRLNRFVRVTTINSNLKQYHERLSINLTATTITATLIWFTLFLHVSTCVWYLLGVIHDNQKPKSSWRWNANKEEMCSNDYICSFYFVMTTFSQNGVGDILPRQQAEVIYVIFLMILSTMMYMIYVGEFSNIMQYQFFRCFNFYSEFLELKEFLKYNRVSANLVDLTYKYTLHLWRTSRGLQVPLFLTDAPPHLRHKLMSAAYMQHLRKHPAFKHCEHVFLRHVVGHFKPFTYHEDMYVVREGEITNAMYFVHKGQIQELIENLDEKTEVFEKGDFFGTNQGLIRETPYAHSYKTLSKAQVLTLSLDDWEYLLDHFPQNSNIIYRPHKGLGDIKQKKRVTISKCGSRDSTLGTPVQIMRKRSRTGTFEIERPLREESPTKIQTAREPFSQDKDTEGLSILSVSQVAEAAGTAAAVASQSYGKQVASPKQTRRKTNVLDITPGSKSDAKSDHVESGKAMTPMTSIHRIDQYFKAQEKLPKQSTTKDSDVTRWPLDSRRTLSIDESSAKEGDHTALASDEPSRWPLDSRRTLSLESSAREEELKAYASDELDVSKQKYARRKSTAFDLERKELSAAKEKEDEYTPYTQDYARRKSKMLNADESITPNTQPLISNRSSAEEIELKSVPYATDEGRSLLASPSERSDDFEDYASLNMSSESTKKPIFDKSKTPVPEETKSFLDKLKNIKSKISQKSHTKILGEKPSLIREQKASFSEDEAEKRFLRQGSSSIIFKDEVTTIEIPQEISLETSPSLARAIKRHAAVEGIDKPSALKKIRSGRSLQRYPTLGSRSERSLQKIPTLEKARTERSLQKIPTLERARTERSLQKIPTLERARTERSLQKIPTLERTRIERSLQKIPTLERARTERSLQKIPTLERARTERSVQRIPTLDETRTVGSLQDLPSKKERTQPAQGSLQDLPSKKERTQPVHGSLQDLPSKKEKIRPAEGSLQDLPSKKEKTRPVQGSLQDLPSKKEKLQHAEGSLQDLPSKKEKTRSAQGSLQDLPSKKEKIRPAEGSLQDLPSKKEKTRPAQGSLQDLPSKKESTRPKEGSLQDLPSKKEKTRTAQKSLQDLPSKKVHISAPEKTGSEGSVENLPPIKGKKYTLGGTRTERSLQDLRSKKVHIIAPDKTEGEGSIENLPSKKSKAPSLEGTRTERSLQDLSSKRRTESSLQDLSKASTSGRTGTEGSLEDLPSKKRKTSSLERSRTERSFQDLSSRRRTERSLQDLSKASTSGRTGTEGSLEDLPSKKRKTPSLERSRTERSLQDLSSIRRTERSLQDLSSRRSERSLQDLASKKDKTNRRKETEDKDQASTSKKST